MPTIRVRRHGTGHGAEDVAEPSSRTTASSTSPPRRRRRTRRSASRASTATSPHRPRADGRRAGGGRDRHVLQLRPRRSSARPSPRAWEVASPRRALLDARLAAADAALRRAARRRPWTTRRVAAPRASPGARPPSVHHGSRPAALQPGPRRPARGPTAPHLALWHAVTLLREFRGDGHVACLVDAGLERDRRPRPPRRPPVRCRAAALQTSRRLGRRRVGGIAVARLAGARPRRPRRAPSPHAGAALRQHIEDQHRRRSPRGRGRPWVRRGCDELRSLVRPLSRAVVHSGTFGVLRPTPRAKRQRCNLRPAWPCCASPTGRWGPARAPSPSRSTTTSPAAASAGCCAPSSTATAPGCPPASACPPPPSTSAPSSTSSSLARRCHAERNGGLEYLVCDEAQFYTPTQLEQLARVVDELPRRRPRPRPPHRLPRPLSSRARPASSTWRTSARSSRSRPAAGAASTPRRTPRLVNGRQVYDGEVVVVGDTGGDAEVVYELLCRRHWLRGETGRAAADAAELVEDATLTD